MVAYCNLQVQSRHENNAFKKIYHGAAVVLSAVGISGQKTGALCWQDLAITDDIGSYEPRNCIGGK